MAGNTQNQERTQITLANNEHMLVINPYTGAAQCYNVRPGPDFPAGNRFNIRDVLGFLPGTSMLIQGGIDTAEFYLSQLSPPQRRQLMDRCQSKIASH